MKHAITNYLKSGYAGLYITSHEETRVEMEVMAACRDAGFRLQAWSLVQGTVDLETGKQFADTENPAVMLAAFTQEKPRTAILLRDFHAILDMKDAGITRRTREVIMDGRQNNRVVIVCGCNLKMPDELKKEFQVVDFQLPDRETLRQVLQSIAESAGIVLNGETDAMLDAASGLTTIEAENAFALSLVEGGKTKFDPAIVAREKAATIKKNGILEIVETSIGVDDIGGFAGLKPWLLKRRLAFGKKAKQYGLPTPKGFLMLGIPGCGKSLAAKATATILGVPLLKLDAGRLFGSLVGQSEENIRIAIQTAESVAPCVLWIDELEKGFSGSKSSGSTDGGTGSRVFGTFLQWMQEKKAGVFVVATANDVSALPPEMLRKGRFDENWFIDLPDAGERQEIFRIHIAKNGRKPEDYDLAALSEATAGFTGAEIESLYVEALFDGFERESEPDTASILRLRETAVPISEMMKEDVARLREWCKNRARPAAGEPKPQAAVARGFGRKLS